MQTDITIDATGGGATFDKTAHMPEAGYDRIVAISSNLDANGVILTEYGQPLAYNLGIAAGERVPLDIPIRPDVTHVFRCRGNKGAGAAVFIRLTLATKTPSGDCPHA